MESTQNWMQTVLLYLSKIKAGSLRCMWGQMVQKYSPAEDAGWTMSV
jgi:hypothetical protein